MQFKLQMEWRSPFVMGVIFKALLNNFPYGPDPALVSN